MALKEMFSQFFITHIAIKKRYSKFVLLLKILIKNKMFNFF